MSSCDELLCAIKSAVQQSTERRNVAVAFSGGLDSGVVAAIVKETASEATLYTVGVEGSHDLIAGEAQSRSIGLPWKPIMMTEDGVMDAVRDMIRITGSANSLMLSFEVPLYFVLKYSAEDLVIGGQGADEVFSGYSKYVGLGRDELRLQKEKDMDALLNVSLKAEKALSDNFGKTIAYPFLDEKVIGCLGGVMLDEVHPDDLRKESLRAVAVAIGQPGIAAMRKKAAQYGSGSVDILRRMAKNRKMSLNEFIAEIADEQL